MSDEGKIDAKIFEPKEKVDNTLQTGDLHLQRPDWLPLVDMFRNKEIEPGHSLESLKILHPELNITEPNFVYTKNLNHST